MTLGVNKLFDECGQRGIFDFLAFIEKNINVFACLFNNLGHG
jgi:hypothetical protein